MKKIITIYKNISDQPLEIEYFGIDESEPLEFEEDDWKVVKTIPVLVGFLIHKSILLKVEPDINIDLADWICVCSDVSLEDYNFIYLGKYDLVINYRYPYLLPNDLESRKEQVIEYSLLKRFKHWISTFN